MNTEVTQDTITRDSIGFRLRSAREKMGLTQQNIAEYLCLKLSTVRDIEEDKSPSDLAVIFLHGYIRSYARLVQIPEEEIFPILKQQNAKKEEIDLIQYPLRDKKKKFDNWLMVFTFLVIFISLGLTGIKWWQNYKSMQVDSTLLNNKKNVQDNKKDCFSVLPDKICSDNHVQTFKTQSTSLSSNKLNKKNENSEDISNHTISIPIINNGAMGNHTELEKNKSTVNSTLVTTFNKSNNHAVISLNQIQVNSMLVERSNDISSSNIRNSSIDTRVLVFNFNSDCWLEVSDAKGKKLFKGMQRNGEKLILSGTIPYLLKIGAPEALQIHYQGQPIDLSRFVRTNQVAHLTIED